eukprot:TRINITY_DN5535_c0_g1_i1.p1 TRINITY_DN5535_c0_g1~~TRINITY_DN5535_c0_g1_i1.p1  ORF type:complete len:219 (-),score=54.29 TRINITY_DN5535_c0_g1_i1:17-616(-)
MQWGGGPFHPHYPVYYPMGPQNPYMTPVMTTQPFFVTYTVVYEIQPMKEVPPSYEEAIRDDSRNSTIISIEEVEEDSETQGETLFIDWKSKEEEHKRKKRKQPTNDVDDGSSELISNVDNNRNLTIRNNQSAYIAYTEDDKDEKNPLPSRFSDDGRGLSPSKKKKKVEYISSSSSEDVSSSESESSSEYEDNVNVQIQN